MIIMNIEENLIKTDIKATINSGKFLEDLSKYLKYISPSTTSDIYIGISVEGHESSVYYLSISTQIKYSIDRPVNFSIFPIRSYNYRKSKYEQCSNITNKPTEININLFRSNELFYKKCCNIIRFNCQIYPSKESIDALMSMNNIFKNNTIEISIPIYGSIRYLDYSNVLFIAVDEKNENILHCNILPENKLKYLIGDTTQIARSKHPEVLMTNKEQYYRSFEIHEIPSILSFFTKSKLIKNSSQPLSDASTQTAIKLARIHKNKPNPYPMIFYEHKLEIRTSSKKYVIQITKTQ